MKWIGSVLLLLANTIGFAQKEELQLTNKDSIVESAWMVGIGWNAVDDAGGEFNNLFNVSDNWNIVPFPSRASLGRYFKFGLGIEAIASYNQYMEGKTVDGTVLTENVDYYAIDFRLSYDLNKIVGETGWFDPYVGIGSGYTEANNEGRQTYNATIGFRTWFTQRFGLDFNTTGKWAAATDANVSNHIQHAAGAVYRFGIKKGLSPRGLDKLALLKEMEAEEQRRLDSITAAQEGEERAKHLLEEEKVQEKEAAEPVAQVDEKEAEKERRMGIEEEVRALGNAIFDLNSSYLSQESKQLLDQLALLMKTHPQLLIEIASHTDTRGTDTYNLWLSQRRAVRTVDYLIQKGIASERITDKAYGEEEPINNCRNGVNCPESEHRQNRRSAFKVSWQ